MLFPTSVANSLIAVGTDGLQERDRMVRAAIAIICELGEYFEAPEMKTQGYKSNSAKEVSTRSSHQVVVLVGKKI